MEMILELPNTTIIVDDKTGTFQIPTKFISINPITPNPKPTNPVTPNTPANPETNTTKPATNSSNNHTDNIINNIVSAISNEVNKIVSNENKYHPIRDYLESLAWDGIPRIENMLPHFLGAEKSKYTIGVMKMHMLAAISRIYEPGIKYDIMLCLVGSQGAGKSTFFKYLAIKEEWFSDNLDHLDDENIYRKLQNHWIIEMGEMKATITAKNIEQIKSFLSIQKETY